MTLQVTIAIATHQTRAAMVEIVTADGRSVAREELTPGHSRDIVLHGGATIRVEEGRMMPPAPPPPAEEKPEPGLTTAEGGE